ncbi:hypothetical protein [Dactylosporangium darangshiense]|jgi:hypothetical protein|uniref:Uncharacterized protein n=1 Tax=Dactylosporangium darangshiense TaxID=579108 RepID=A0ABP8DHL3_9ACTN|nr:hypothetical protein [Dactylosporangium sp.]
MAKKLIVGQSEWTISDEEAPGVAKLVREAMQSRTLVELPLLDGAGRAVTVFLNGAVAPTVVLDLDGVPRPSEMA